MQLAEVRETDDDRRPASLCALPPQRGAGKVLVEHEARQLKKRRLRPCRVHTPQRRDITAREHAFPMSQETCNAMHERVDAHRFDPLAHGFDPLPSSSSSRKRSGNCFFRQPRNIRSASLIAW